MNAQSGLPDGGDEPVITLISMDRINFYLFEGEEFINQLLLEDGVFPRPVRCINFTSSISLNIFIGEGKNLSHFWGINPEIVDRLRKAEHLQEIDDPQD